MLARTRMAKKTRMMKWTRMCKLGMTLETWRGLTISSFVVEEILGHTVDKDVRLAHPTRSVF